jgi:hypothetical protein
MSALIDSSVKKMGPIIHTQGGSKKKPLKRGGVGFFETRLVTVSNAIVNRAKMRARNRKTTSSSQSFIQDPDVPSEQQLSDMNTLEIFNDDTPEINDTLKEYGPINSEVKRLIQYIYEKYKSAKCIYYIFLMLSLVTSFITIPFATNYIGVYSMINVDTLFTTELSSTTQYNPLGTTNVTASGLCDGSNTEMFYNPDKNTVRYSCYAHNEYMSKLLHKYAHGSAFPFDKFCNRELKFKYNNI